MVCVFVTFIVLHLQVAISLYRPAWWTIFRPPFEGKLVPIVFLCCFLLYQICSYVSMQRVPKTCMFVEKVGKPHEWSAMGCDGLTPWSAGRSSLVPKPLAAVPFAAARPRLPGRGRMPRWVGSPSVLADEGHLGCPPISFAPPLPATSGWWMRWQIGRFCWQVRLPGQQIQRTTQ